MLLPLAVTGVFLGLIFKSSMPNKLPFWRFVGTVGPVLAGVVIGILTFIKAGMAGLGGAALAVSTMGVSAVFSHVILYIVLDYVQKKASGQKKPEAGIIQIFAGDPETLQQMARLGMGLMNDNSKGSKVTALLSSKNKETEPQEVEAEPVE